MQFKHANILRTSDELSPPNFFLGSIIPKTPEMKKFTKDRNFTATFDVAPKMLGCLNCKYANCIFIRRRLKNCPNSCNHKDN